MFLIDAFNYSDLMGKGIVFILIVVSCWCWGQVVNKRVDTASIRSHCRKFLEFFGKYKFEKPLRIFGELENKKIASPLAELTRAVRETLVGTLKLDSAQRVRLVEDGLLPRSLQQSELDALRTSLNRAITIQINQLETGMIGMSTAISVSPMLGLFGTVYGVLATFVGITNAGGRPDIAAIAPGISGALLTTVMGLFVAIPAIITNNFSVKAVNQVINELELYAEDLFTAVQHASESAAQEEKAAEERRKAEQQAAFPPVVPPMMPNGQGNAAAMADFGQAMPGNYATAMPPVVTPPQPPPLQRPVPPPMV